MAAALSLGPEAMLALQGGYDTAAASSMSGAPRSMGAADLLNMFGSTIKIVGDIVMPKETKFDPIKYEHENKLRDLGLLKLGPQANRALRGQYVKSGDIPPEYSDENIVSSIEHGNLPNGWNEYIAAEQGYGPEIARYKRKTHTKRLLEAANFIDNDLYHTKVLTNYFLNDARSKDMKSRLRMFHEFG